MVFMVTSRQVVRVWNSGKMDARVKKRQSVTEISFTPFITTVGSASDPL
jgi:hypothetical protein